MLSESKLKAQPFIPELRDSLESEKQDIIGSNSEEPSDLKPPSDNLVKPSEIRKFVRSNSRCKIELWMLSSVWKTAYLLIFSYYIIRYI